MATEPERTLSEPRLCGFCGATLTGGRPDARFCRDACRTASGRAAQRQRLVAQLDAIVLAVDALRHELRLDPGDDDVANGPDEDDRMPGGGTL